MKQLAIAMTAAALLAGSAAGAAASPGTGSELRTVADRRGAAGLSAGPALRADPFATPVLCPLGTRPAVGASR